MSEKPVERRLAAILAADVVGYSRLMGIDEIGTLRALNGHRRELIDPAIRQRGGRIVKTTGDGMLVEFPSAVEAVACAIIVQRGLALRNAPIAAESRLVFRIGINVGDIIVQANDIFGDGVNVAARLEGVCRPGGLCISRAVHDEVRGKLPVTFDDLGEQQVKNIARLVPAFGLSPEAVEAAPELEPSGGARRRRLFPVALAIGAVAALGAGWWGLAPRSGPASPTGAQSIAAAPVGGVPKEPASMTMPAMTDRASIAVLPFAAASEAGNPDYFADGLTEDIIAALGRFREISVISRGGVSAYKGKSPTPAAVGHDLKVRYVVEGSVRRSDDRIRVSASLTGTERGNVLWSEKYDTAVKDVFSVQDRITRQISGAIAIRVTGLELETAAAKPPSNMEAYDLVLRGRDLVQRVARAPNAEARGLFENAITLDPNYEPAYVGLGNVELNSATQGWTPDPSGALERAENLARKAIGLDPSDPRAQALLGNVAVYFGDYDRALDALKRAVDLNGSDADAYSGLTSVLLWRGDLAGAISAGELLLQFRPALSATEAFHLATAYFLSDRLPDAVRVLEPSLDRNPGNLYTNAMLAACYAALGRKAEAESRAAIVRQQSRALPREEFGSLLRNPAQRDKFATALAGAGL